MNDSSLAGLPGPPPQDLAISPELGYFLFAELLRIRDMGCDLEHAVAAGDLSEDDYMAVGDMCHCGSCQAGYVLYVAWNAQPGLGEYTGHAKMRFAPDPQILERALPFAAQLLHEKSKVQTPEGAS